MPGEPALITPVDAANLPSARLDNEGLERFSRQILFYPLEFAFGRLRLDDTGRLQYLNQGLCLRLVELCRLELSVNLSAGFMWFLVVAYAGEGYAKTWDICCPWFAWLFKSPACRCVPCDTGVPK